jgi:hypothetical protein
MQLAPPQFEGEYDYVIFKSFQSFSNKSIGYTFF